MSDIDDCASQEIDASDSSISTKNSKKYCFVRSILNVDQSQNLCGNGKQSILLGDIDSRLLPPGKREFIHNWILTHGDNATLSPIPRTRSSVLGVLKRNSPAKRSVNSEIYDNQCKRGCRDISAKENFAVFTNGEAAQESSSDETIVIENEESQGQQLAALSNISNNDSNATYVNSPILNGNTSSSAFNASRISCKFFAGEASKERRNTFRESSKTPKTTTLLSPLARIGRAEIDKRSAKQSWEGKNNGRGNKISTRLSGIAGGKSSPMGTEKLGVNRARIINDRKSLDRDNSILRKNVSSPYSFTSNGNASHEMDTEIEKRERLSRRLSWLEGKNISMKLELRPTSKNCNHQCPVRRSSKLTDAASSTHYESDRIDVESSIPADEEIKIESDSDDARSDFIESVETQNPGASSATKNICKIENAPSVPVERRFKPRRDLSCDSDETYYSDADLVASVASSPKYSQRISQQRSDIRISYGTNEPSVGAAPSQDKSSDILISEVASPIRQNLDFSGYVAPLNRSSDNNKKKKQAKKGSLLAKLQSLVRSQVSNLHIWQYQMSEPKFMGSHTQFVTLRVIERETRWCRHYITASLIADSHNLLNDLFESQSDSTNRSGASSRETRMLTLMIVPEVTGAIKIKANSTLNIYPPWDIMHRDKKILNVMYFKVIPDVTNVDAAARQKKRSMERILGKFDCPCIRSNAIVESCPEKFSDRKPSVMQALFRDSVSSNLPYRMRSCAAFMAMIFFSFVYHSLRRESFGVRSIMFIKSRAMSTIGGDSTPSSD